MVFIVSCENLTQPENGMIKCSLGEDAVISYGDVCNFTCDTGYILVGSESRICQNDGFWSGNQTYCSRGTYVAKYISTYVRLNYLKQYAILLESNLCMHTY